MNELLNWLLLQKGGIRTYLEFQNRALDLRASEPEHAALLRLLADLAGRFAEAYDGEPLSVDVAERALGQLSALLEKAIAPGAIGPAEHLALLNEIGQAELV
ncbi:hypothetical protein [Bosea sp. BK604]|uniref:hypothetical protein n=1 Tax=Bosea sp. BK604 TaxID=2512180 RepID=UPI00104EABFA|nr:hypothetical protein [Bosea sp. BK604]TCR61355.1 hypothetical protein EV560_11317 [Bosea sp. BK604]